MKQRGHFTIRGRVQGVCYRMYARDRAEELGLAGWIRNRSDGSVEVVAEGEESAIVAFRDWCRVGPPLAVVTDVRDAYAEPTGEFRAFDITF